MRVFSAGIVLATMLATPAQASRCGGSSDVLHLDSWGFIPAAVGEAIDVTFTYPGDRGIIGLNADVLFTDTNGVELSLPLNPHTKLEPGATGHQMFDVPETGYAVLADEQVEAVICTNTIDYADGGSVIIN